MTRALFLLQEVLRHRNVNGEARDGKNAEKKAGLRANEDAEAEADEAKVKAEREAQCRRGQAQADELRRNSVAEEEKKAMEKKTTPRKAGQKFSSSKDLTVATGLALKLGHCSACAPGCVGPEKKPPHPINDGDFPPLSPYPMKVANKAAIASAAKKTEDKAGKAAAKAEKADALAKTAEANAETAKATAEKEAADAEAAAAKEKKEEGEAANEAADKKVVTHPNPLCTNSAQACSNAAATEAETKAKPSTLDKDLESAEAQAEVVAKHEEAKVAEAAAKIEPPSRAKDLQELAATNAKLEEKNSVLKESQGQLKKEVAVLKESEGIAKEAFAKECDLKSRVELVMLGNLPLDFLDHLLNTCEDIPTQVEELIKKHFESKAAYERICQELKDDIFEGRERNAALLRQTEALRDQKATHNKLILGLRSYIKDLEDDREETAAELNQVVQKLVFQQEEITQAEAKAAAAEKKAADAKAEAAAAEAEAADAKAEAVAAKKVADDDKAKAKAKAKAKEEKAKAKLKGVARLLKEERKEAAEDASSRAEREAEAAILRAEHEAAEVEAAKRRTERTEQLEAEMLSDSGSQSRSQSRDDSQSQSRSPIDCFENQLNAKAAATSRSPDEAYAADKKSATGAPGLEIVPFHTGLASGDALAELEEILMAELEEILIKGTTEEKISTSTVSQVKAIIDANALLFCLNKSLPTNNLAEPGPSGDEMIKRLCCVREWLANQDFPLSSLLTQLQTDYALTGKGKLINMIKFVQNAEDYSDFMSKQEASGATPKLPHSKTSKKEKALRDWMTKQGKRLGKATLTWENPVEMYALLEIVETYPEVDIFSDPEISDKVRDRPQNIPKLQSGPGFLRETVTMERHDMCSPALKAPEAAATWTQGEHTEFGGVKFPSDGGVKNQGVDQEELD